MLADNRGMPLAPDSSPAAKNARRNTAAARRLARRLAKLRGLFDLEAIARQTGDAAQVVAYYHQNFHPYRRYHSQAGAMHMALNAGGRFDEDGFYGQARRIEGLWKDQPPTDVLELAFGKGINLAYLAPRWPQVRFSGIDLTPRNVKHAKSQLALADSNLLQGDLHAPPFESASFDCVFCVEGFCHATDVPRALAAQARILRLGGLLVLFDGYREMPLKTMSSDEALAVTLVEKSMAVDAFQQIEDFIAQAAVAGFDLVSNESLVDAVMPSLNRLDRLARLFLLVPPLTRRWLARRPTQRGDNLAAAALMRHTVSMGLQGYRQLVLRKRAG
ncbi:MAG: class I SAM-dependent methyltransferase [Burkholderiales bacterium]